ncbi:unnamed protein product [Schistosoma turkestanicum]|nr:unnamed protein product [Schistosoma turkestanicum]
MIPTVKERQAGSYDFKKYYEDLCALRSCAPLSAITNHVSNGFLDICADRIKIQDWDPVIDAIKVNKNLNFIAVRNFSNSGGVVFLNRRRPPVLLSSSKILFNLCRAIRYCAYFTENLTFLELQNLPLNRISLLQICEGIKKNRTLKHLSFEGSSINDDGLKELCLVLRFVPNISTLNLTACNLSKDGISPLTVLINHQAMQRHNAAWQESLRYRLPELDRLGGLKRITLNDNPNIGDEGSIKLADTLIDDLWVKAIDLQACNLSDNSASIWLSVLVGLRITDGNPTQTNHDEGKQLKSKDNPSVIDDQHRGNYTLVVLDLRRNPDISHELLRAVTERALINSEGKQTEFSWLTAGLQTPSQLCSGVTTYPWPGLTNHESNEKMPSTMMSRVNSFDNLVQMSRTNRTKSITTNLYKHRRIIDPDDKKLCCSCHRPLMNPSGSKPRRRSEGTKYFFDHTTNHNCNVELHRKTKRPSYVCETGRPLSERAAWKPPGVAKTTNQKLATSQPITPLSNRTSFTGGIPWRTAARSARCRGYPNFHCPGKTSLDVRALNLDYDIVKKSIPDKQASNVNNMNQNSHKSLVHSCTKPVNGTVNDDDDDECQHHHQSYQGHSQSQPPQHQQQCLQHNHHRTTSQKSCSKASNSPRFSAINMQHKLKQLMKKVTQLEEDLQIEKQKSDQLIKSRQFVQHEDKSKQRLEIDQNSVDQLRTFICRLTDAIENLQKSKEKSNISNEEFDILQDTFEELCALLSRITEQNYLAEKMVKNLMDKKKPIATTYGDDISSDKKDKEKSTTEKNIIHHNKSLLEDKTVVHNNTHNNKQGKRNIHWKTVAKTRAVQTDDLETSVTDDDAADDDDDENITSNNNNHDRKPTTHKHQTFNPKIAWIPSTCIDINATEDTSVKSTITNSYNTSSNSNNNNKVFRSNSKTKQGQDQLTNDNNNINNNTMINNHNDIHLSNDSSSDLDNHHYVHSNKNNTDDDDDHHHHDSIYSTEKLIDNMEIYKKSSQTDQLFAELKAATIIGTPHSSKDDYDMKSQLVHDIKQLNDCIITGKKSTELYDIDEISILNNSNNSPCVFNDSNHQNIHNKENFNTIEDNNKWIDQQQVNNTTNQTIISSIIHRTKSNEFHPLNIEQNNDHCMSTIYACVQ